MGVPDVVQPSGGGNPGIGRQLGGLPGGMQKVLSGEGKHVGELLGVAGGMQKVLSGDGRQVPDGGVGVLGGMQKELSGDGRQPLLGGLVGGLVAGATGSQPPMPGNAVPPMHEPVPETPMGNGGLHPLTGAGSQTEAD